MKSRTKFPVTHDDVKRLFAAAGMGDAVSSAPLGAGEYNTVMSVKTDNGKEYALKIAPSPEAEILAYEKGMMQAEIYWYDTMRKHTSIRVPEVYYCDFTRKLLPADWFIMEKLSGAHPSPSKMNDDEKRRYTERMAQMAAELHKIKNDRFGYIQGELYDSWYEAIRAMTVTLISECEAKGRRTTRGERLLGYIDRYKDVLARAECCMVNYDIWAPNIIVSSSPDGYAEYQWIDPERSFWGDRMADFICLELTKPLKEKTASIAAYNEVADIPVKCTREEEIRWAVMCAYMGLLQETEKYYRYTPLMAGWWRNVISGGLLSYRMGFAALERGE